jgi:NAD-dependent DNA ligase
MKEYLQQKLMDFIVEPKIDGLSATCRYSGGNSSMLQPEEMV